MTGFCFKLSRAKKRRRRKRRRRSGCKLSIIIVVIILQARVSNFETVASAISLISWQNLGNNKFAGINVLEVTELEKRVVLLLCAVTAEDELPKFRLIGYDACLCDSEFSK